MWRGTVNNGSPMTLSLVSTPDGERGRERERERAKRQRERERETEEREKRGERKNTVMWLKIKSLSN